MPGQPFLRLLQQDTLVKFARDAAQHDGLPRLNSKKHLSEELLSLFWLMGKNYPQKSFELLSQSVRGCAIIHVGFLSLVFDAPYYTGFIEGKPFPFPELHISRSGGDCVRIPPCMMRGARPDCADSGGI